MIGVRFKQVEKFRKTGVQGCTLPHTRFSGLPSTQMKYTQMIVEGMP
jgi:hypothetical protein